MSPITRTPYPLDGKFYADLVADRPAFERSWKHVVRAGTGYGFEVSTSQAFRLVIIEEPQVIDLCVMSAADPYEHYSTGAQMAIEGAKITRGTRVWGTPPNSRPLCTCVADTLREQRNAQAMRDHFGASGHCNAHLWYLETGRHNRPCYDNLRQGMAMVGLSQRYIHDNMNIFQKSALDPVTGALLVGRSDAAAGDYIEFFAETDLYVVLSLCPIGSGPPSNAREIWEGGGVKIPVFPVGVEVYDTGFAALGWPYSVSGSPG